MNLAWEVILRAMAQGLDPEELRFHPDFGGSPYRETAFTDVNLAEVTNPQVGMNLLYRFTNVFGPTFDVNENRYSQLREMLVDVFFHYQSQLDLRAGLTKSEYYIRAILRDLLSGAYGQKAANAIKVFSNAEAKKVLHGILTLFRSGSSMELFRQVVRAVYPRAIVYRNSGIYRELLIYLPQKKNNIDEQKLDFLSSLFLNINYTVYAFWEHHFGIIDLEETLVFDEMVIF